MGPTREEALKKAMKEELDESTYNDIIELASKKYWAPVLDLDE